MERKLLLIGGGGHCHSVIDSVLSMNVYSEIGIIDNKETTMFNVSVVGNDDDIQSLKEEGWTDAFVTVGSVGDTVKRRHLYKMLNDYGMSIPNIVDPTAVIAHDVLLGYGIYIGKKAVVNPGTKIGACTIINTGSVIEHDCVVGAYSHISPGAIICGHVIIGSDTHIGAGSVIRQGINVGQGCMIGAGSVVVKDIPPNTKAYGNPCRVIK